MLKLFRVGVNKATPPAAAPAPASDAGKPVADAKPTAASTSDTPTSSGTGEGITTTGAPATPDGDPIKPEPVTDTNQTSAQPFPTTAEDDPSASELSPALAAATSSSSKPPAGNAQRMRRLSFRSFGFFYGRSTVNVATATEEDSHEDTVEGSVDDAHTEPALITPVVSPSTSQKIKKPHKPTRSEKRINSYALLLRSIIIGTPPSSSSSPSSSSKEPSVKKLKSELLKPKEANLLIAQIRNLPTPDTSKGVLHGTLRGLNGKLVEQDISVVPSGKTPIHAVCLDCTDDEADARHFGRLTATSLQPVKSTVMVSLTPDIAKAPSQPTALSTSDPPSRPNIAQADLSSVIPVLRDLKLIDLVAQSIDLVTDTIGSPANDFGFGQPVGAGVLSGSVPSSSTVAQGLMQVGQEFLNLGFATSAAVVPNHQGIYPPKDRLSALTYWWGYEVVIPPASMKFLGNCSSISHALLNFLTAFSLFNNGVREILPFVRYASQFIDFEWNAVKGQDKGKGVVCAATWVMPAALVPRPWDFDEPPKGAAARLDAYMRSRSTPTPFLPGTEVIVNPLQQAGTPQVPMVTLSPPTLADAIVATDDEP